MIHIVYFQVNRKLLRVQLVQNISLYNNTGVSALVLVLIAGKVHNGDLFVTHLLNSVATGVAAAFLHEGQIIYWQAANEPLQFFIVWPRWW